jgi:glycosyltransferase involved in cell wall biosynthesis
MLGAHCAQWSSNVHVLPHGVSLEAFPLDASSSGVMTTGGSPVIGYIGGLHKAFDDQLMREVVTLRPDWTWEFVGSVQIDRALLPTGPNVRLLGARPHSELIEHLRRFDVCLIPYRENEFTAMVVPTKLNEYLAAGKAVVSTRIPAVVEFNQQHQVIQIAEASAGPFIEAIERALRSAHDEAESHRRREVAALSDWSERMELIAGLIEQVQR